jgi:hypothetical protein
VSQNPTPKRRLQIATGTPTPRPNFLNVDKGDEIGVLVAAPVFTEEDSIRAVALLEELKCCEDVEVVVGCGNKFPDPAASPSAVRK